MAITQLQIYNKALLLVGERALSSLTEDREPRYLLDQLWNVEDEVTTCLEDGQWRFAMRAIKIDYDPRVAEPSFGYHRAFLKPADWVLTSGVCSDEFFRMPLTQYFDERGYWWAEIDTIYVRYVSNDPAWGKNMALWPNSFQDYVGADLAARVALKIVDDEKRLEVMLKIAAQAKRKAKSRAAMSAASVWEAQGSWTRARQRWLGRKDSGNTSGNLIG